MFIPTFKYYTWFTVVLFFCLPYLSVGQDSFGLRISPHIIGPPEVFNPSAAAIYGERRFSFDAGVDYSRMFSKNFSVIGGLNVGLLDFNHVLVAPGDAFGDFASPGSIYANSNNDNFVYTGLYITPGYRFTLKGSAFHLSAGPNIRLYHGAPGADVATYAFNRTTPFDHATDPADFAINIPSARGKISTDLTSSLTIERTVSTQTSLRFGVRYNIGFTPVSKGSMYVNLYGQRYDGRYDVRSNYIGLDLQLRYSTKLVNTTYTRSMPLPSDRQDFRRAIFIDVLGSSPFASIAYDMRIRRHHNDGLGFRAGFGLGSFIETDDMRTPRNMSIPLGINYILGRKRHGFETGIGYTVQFITANPKKGHNNSSFANLNIGYRFQPLRDGLLFRVYWTPTYKNNDFYYNQPGDADFHTHWAGASIGFSFR